MKPTTTPPASPRRFNLNVLHRINRELGGNFDLYVLHAPRDL